MVTPFSSLRNALLCLAIGALVGGWSGWALRGDHEDAQRLKAVQTGIVKTAQGKAQGDSLAARQAQAQADQAQADQVITKEIVRYVEVTPAADRCTLPGAWRVRHDAAATGEPAEPARLAHGAADPVEDAAALETVGDNYAICRHAIEQVKGWQDWWAMARQYCGADHGQP